MAIHIGRGPGSDRVATITMAGILIIDPALGINKAFDFVIDASSQQRIILNNIGLVAVLKNWLPNSSDFCIDTTKLRSANAAPPKWCHRPTGTFGIGLIDLVGLATGLNRGAAKRMLHRKSYEVACDLIDAAEDARRAANPGMTLSSILKMMEQVPGVFDPRFEALALSHKKAFADIPGAEDAIRLGFS